MFKCTGICSKCGKCQGAAMMSGANDRKTKMLAYPDGFKADGGRTGLGAAFDIGTTTAVGMLWDLEKGEQIATEAKTNPQNEFGMDVISRITYCTRDDENVKQLRSLIVDCINDIIDSLWQKASRSKSEIVTAAVCGNTTMSHIFAGYSPINLAKAPFTPEYTGMISLTGKETGLNVCETAEVVVVPNIAGHVGGDITAGIIASRLLESRELTVFIDLGTNGEIVLTDGKNSYACSTAAGPAFEGAAISCGMRAAIGAIERVRAENGEIYVDVIGDTELQGICGSGLIDTVAVLLEQNIINKKGRMAAASEAEAKGIDARFAERLTEVDGERQFILAKKKDGDHIVITQNDIRELQLAKGAIKAGVQLMLNEAGYDVGDIKRVMVAGAFGNYIDKESAVKIGILPNVPLEKIISVGNTAGAGVSMIMASEGERKLAEAIPSKIKYVELANSDDFQMTYVNAMKF